jgi:hypothetical protein
MEFRQPTIILKENGQARKAGFELEFGETDIETISGCITQLYGGTRNTINYFWEEITDTEFGNFSVKMDSRLLTEKPYEKIVDFLGFKEKERDIEKFIESVASVLIPYEIVTPPVQFSQVHRLDALRELLYMNEAKGTRTSVLRAFATHINAELPALNVDTILTYLRAFLLLYPWVFQKSKIDFTRKISNFITPFPEEYISLVLPDNYNPDFDQFLIDYQKYNPDRNRPLDLYPVLGFINPDKVMTLEGIGNVKPRPTFHYRLPNSLIDNPDWSLASEWNCWVAIENLAAAPEKIKDLSEEYIKTSEQTFMGFRNKWIRRTDDWVEC